MTVVLDDTAETAAGTALLVNLLATMRGVAHLRVERRDGTVVVGRLLEGDDTDRATLLRLRPHGQTGDVKVDLNQCRAVGWTNDVSF